MNTLTPEQLSDLLLKISDHGKAQAKAFLNGDASIAGSAGTECLEFYDRWREESFPDAPMGEVVEAKQWDLVYDEYFTGFKSAFQPVGSDSTDLRSLLIEVRYELESLVARMESETNRFPNVEQKKRNTKICSARVTLSKLQSIKA